MVSRFLFSLFAFFAFIQSFNQNQIWSNTKHVINNEYTTFYTSEMRLVFCCCCWFVVRSDVSNGSISVITCWAYKYEWKLSIFLPAKWNIMVHQNKWIDSYTHTHTHTDIHQIDDEDRPDQRHNKRTHFICFSDDRIVEKNTRTKVCVFFSVFIFSSFTHLCMRKIWMQLTLKNPWACFAIFLLARFFRNFSFVCLECVSPGFIFFSLLFSFKKSVSVCVLCSTSFWATFFLVSVFCSFVY